MAREISGGSPVTGAATASTGFSHRSVIRILVALIMLGGLAVAAYLLHGRAERGAPTSFSLLVGTVLGIVFQRGRFCFFCILRDLIEQRDSRPMFAILAALAVGGTGYTVLFGAFLPNPASGRLPPDAHIGPVSWALVMAGIAFGIGMALSGACISGHLYRLGEGYTRAPFALLGSLVGFALGFFTWNTLYLSTIAAAPVPWLPATFGYSGALVIHLVALGVSGLLLLRRLPELPPTQGGKLTLARLYEIVLCQRWNPLVTGASVGIIGTVAYLRSEPLGVTAQLGSTARTLFDKVGLLADHLHGLDTFAGCAMPVVQALTDNGFLIGGLVLGSFAAALLATQVQLSRLTIHNATTALLGGVLMGWGSVTALGCTVGTLLSGISAFALSGWVFGAAIFAGVWLGLKLRLHS